MEEKILYPQADLPFDIQRFAETITLDASDDEKKSTTVGTLTYTVTANTATLTIDNTTVTINSGTVDISGTTKKYTFNVSSGATTIINGVDFKSDGGTKIAFGKNNSTVTLTGAFTIGDGEQNLSLSINDVTYSGAGKIAVTTSNITLSGEVTAKNNLTGKTYSLNGNDDLNTTFSLKSGDETKISDVTYSAANGVEINVVKDKITLVSGTVTVGTGSESLGDKEFSVTSAKATFNPKPLTDVTIDGVKYTSKASVGTIEVDGTVTLNGAFDITLEAGKSITLNDVKFTADSAKVTFTLNSTTNEVTFTNGSLSMEVNGDLKVNGITYQDANGTIDLEDDSTVTLGGDFTVGANGESLSGTTFSTTSGDSTFNVANGDEITLNDATFTAGNSGLTLEYEASDDSVTIDGTSAQVTGTGHFYLNNDVTINGTKFSSTEQYPELTFTANDTVELSSSFTIGNENKSLNLTVDGITYSGTGQLKVNNNDDITLSGSSITVGKGSESLDGKTYTTDSCEVTFNISEDDTVTINSDEYTADTGGGSVDIATNSGVTVSNSSVTFSDESTGPKNLTIAKDKTLTVGDFKYTASANEDATITVEDKKITITSGTVAIEAGDLTGYTFKTSGNAEISEISNATGTFQWGDTQTFDVQNNAKVTYTLNNNVIESISTDDGATIDITDGTVTQSSVTLTSEKPLTKYTKGWYDSPPYDYYLIKNNEVYGVYEDDEPSSEVVTTAVYNNFLTFRNSTVTLNSTASDKTLKIEGAYTAVSKGNTYAISADGAATFSNTDEDGIDSIESGTVTASSGKAIDVELGENAVLNVGTRFSYTETDTTKTSANISVDANGGVTVKENGGTIEKKVKSGTFIYSGGTYTVDSSATFKVTDSEGTRDGDYLISGGGTSDIAVNAAFNLDNKSYTAQSGAKFVAKSDDDGGYTAFSGTALYTESGGNFTAANDSDKEYTISGNATYQLTGKGLKENNTESTLKNATGTRAFVSGTDSESKAYLGDNYTVTDGIYSVDVTNGTVGTKSLTSGSATYSVDNGRNFHYIYDNSTREYTATNDTTIEISFTDNDITVGNESSGEGTRNADGSTDKTTYNNDTYTLDSTAKIKLTLSDVKENFNEGTAQYSASSGEKFHSNDGTEYTAKEDATLTLTKNSTETSTSLKTGSGTRADSSATTFMPKDSNKTYTTSNGVTYILEPEQSEVVYNASGSRTNVSGETYPIGNHTYTLTSGTYDITVNEKVGTESLTNGEGSGTIAEGITFNHNSKTYTAVDGGVTLNLRVVSSTETETFEDGKGTRTAENNETTVSTVDSGNTYTIGNNSKMLLTTSGETLYNGSATRTTNSTFKVTDNTNTYTAYSGNATLTLTKFDGGTENVKLTAGSGTREQSATTFTYSDNTYTDTATSGNVTYALKTNQTEEELFSAQGTRDYNDGNVTFNEDTYTMTGKYSFSLNNGTYSENLNATGIYSAGNGSTFHFGGKTYQGFDGGATLTISYDGTNKGLTSASGKGTRTLGVETFNHTSTDGNTYVVNQDATIKVDITNKDTSAETFYNGTATQTYTSGSGVFNFKSKAYTAQGDANLTLTKSNGGSESVSLTGSGTRTDNATTFTATGVTGTYTKTGDNIVYQIANSADEKVYSAIGTRTDVTTENHVGDWGNTYTLSAGTRTLTVTDGASTDVLTSASATKNYANGNTFNYDTTEYTATTYGVTLSLSIAEDEPTESFSSGSGKNDTGYIVKGGSNVDIGDVTYAAAADSVVTVTGTTAITGISGGTITGTFNNNSATIGDIVYSGTGKLKINADVNDVSAESVNFTATGDFSTARTINGSRTLEIDDDSDVKVTFSTGDVTKIEKLSNGAYVKNAAGTTEVVTDSNGTFKFSQQTITIQNDSNTSVTFTLDGATGIVTGISGLSRDDSGAYVTAEIIETNGQTYSLNVRKPGENLIPRNDDGTWTEPTFTIYSYIVTYDSDFTVQAVASDTVITLTETDYTVGNGNTLVITNHQSVPIVVKNTSNETITIDNISVNNTGNNSAQIDTGGNLHIGTQNPDGTFTESTDIPQFYVSNEGKFSISDDGTVTVEAKESTEAVEISITDTSKASVAIKGNGTFIVNGNSTFKIEDTSEDGSTPVVSLVFGANGSVTALNVDGTCEITDESDTYEDDDEDNVEVTTSGLLAQSADAMYTYIAKTINGTRVIISGDNDGKVTWQTTKNGDVTSITGVKGVSDDATIKITDGTISNFNINGNDGNIIENVSLNQKIRKNSYTESWICGNVTSAIGSYKAEINANGEIILKDSDGKQTKNVIDYTTAFGSSYVPKNGTVEEDDADLPKYSSDTGITLTAGKVTELKISPPGSKEYTINSKTITLNGETKLTPVSSNNFGGNVKLELKNGTSAIYDGMTFSGNNANTNIKIPSGTGTDTVVTIDDKTKVTGVTSDSSFSAKGDIVLDGITIKDIGNTYKTISGITTSGDTTGLTVDSKALSVKNDSQYTVSAGTNKYISGVKGGSELSGDFITAQNVSIVTESVGNIKIGSNSYVISGDGSVTLNSSNGTVTKIDDLGASASVTGNFSGDSGVKINSEDNIVKVTGDTDIGVALSENSAISKIYNLSSGAVVDNAGGATLLSTDGNGGTFNLGKTYSLSGGADFKSTATSGAPVITEIRNVSGGTSIKASQIESGLVIGNDTITVGNVDVIFEMGNGTISGVTGLTSNVKGLSTGATVKVTSVTDLSINGSDVNITSSGNILAYAKSDAGYSTVTGIKKDATITKAAKDAVIIPDEAGTFTFGATGSQHKFKTDSKATFTMGNSNTVSAIGGVSGNIALYQNETGLKVLNDTITITGATSNDVVTLVAGSGSVNQVKNLKGNVNGLNAGAIANVKQSGSITINTKTLNVSGDSDYTVRAKDGGYDLITGLSNGANVSAVEGNVSLVTDGVGTYTFDGNKFDIAGDEEVTFKIGSDSKLTDIAGVSYATISVYSQQNGLKINGKAINVEGTADSPVKVKIGGAGEILGFDGLKSSASYSLPAGATINIDTTGEVTINGKQIQLTNNVNGVQAATVRATDDGYDLVTGLSNNAVVTKGKDATFVTDEIGTYTFNEHKFNITDDDKVTITTSNADIFSVSAINGVNGASITVYQAEDGVAINGAKVTLGTPASNKSTTLNIDANGNLVGVGGISASGTYSLPSNITIGVETTGELQINGKDLSINDGGDDKYTVHSTSDGYDSIVGLTSGAVITKAKENATLYSSGSTVNVETYTFIDKAFTAKGDATIGFVMGASNNLAGIGDFNGTISGNFSDGVTVNNKTVNVTGDTAISIVGSGGTEGISKITNLTDGATVNNAGGATTISTDGNGGKFQFGATSGHTISLSAGTANFLAVQTADYVPSITGIKDIDTNATVEIYQDENSLVVENNTIKLTGATSSAPVKLAMNGDTIKGVENLTGEISGLSKGATVKVTDDDVIINGVPLQIDEGSGNADIIAYASHFGYGTVTGVSNNATVKTAESVSLMTDAAGTFVFGGTVGQQHKFETSVDTEIKFVTDDDSNVTEIKGIDQNNAVLAVYQNEDININGKAINIGGIGNYAGSSAVSLKFDTSGNITEVSNLTGSISNLPASASVQVADSDVTINGATFKINKGSGATDATVRTGINGYSTIKGITDGVNITEAPNASLVATISAGSTGTYTFGTDKFVVNGDSDVTLSTDYNSKVTAIGGLANATLTLYQNEEDLVINGRTIKLKDVPQNDNVAISVDGSGNIVGVGNLKGYIENLPANATVNVTDTAATINGAALTIDEGSNSANVTVRTTNTGYDLVQGISNATVTAAKNASLVTDNTGTFVFGENKDHTITVYGDSDVTLAADANSKITAIDGFNGTLTSSEDNIQINNVGIYNTGDDVSIIAAAGVSNGISSIYGLTDNDQVTMPSGVAVSIEPNDATDTTSFTINGTAYDLTGDSDGIIITDRTITGLAADARLTISAVGSFNVNTKNLELTTDRQIVIGEGENAARLYNPADIDFGANTPVEDVVKQVLGTDVALEDATISANYTDNIWTVTDTSKSIVVTDSDTGKTINITGSSDILIVHATANNITINTSSDTGKANTVVSSGENITVTGNNNTHVMPTSGKSITYTEYDHSNNAGIQITNSDVAAAVRDKSLQFGDFTITLPNSATVNISYASGKEGIVNFYNIQGEMQKVGYAYSDHATLNYKNGSEDIVLRGNWGNNISSYLYGGNGNDTAFGGAGDYFDLGNGANAITISGGSGQATVESSAVDGNTTVTGFTNINTVDGDIIKINTGITNADYSNGVLTLTQNGNNSKLIIQDMTAKEEDVDTKVGYVNVLFDNSNDTSDDPIKTSVAKEGAVIKVAASTNDNDFTTAYAGHNSGVDFSTYGDGADTIDIRLGDGSGTLTPSGGTATSIALRGITSLKGNAGTHTLIGSASESNTLEAGLGNGSIWGGGASDDYLIAAPNYSDSNTRKASTFFFRTGDGNDTIDNFQFYTTEGENSDTQNAQADVVYLNQNVSSIEKSGSDIVIKYSYQNEDNEDEEEYLEDSLTLKNGLDKKFKIIVESNGTTSTALMEIADSNLTYNANGNAIYAATSANATLSMTDDSGITGNTVINLNDSIYSGNVAAIDASSYTGEAKLTLTGSHGNSTIKAAKNGSELWGNTGSGNDLLIGGEGADIFRFGYGHGNDTINGLDSNDTIYFDGIGTLTAGTFTLTGSGSDYVISFSNGQTLTLQESCDSTVMKFKLSDGNIYKGWSNLKSGTVYTESSGGNEGNNTEPTEPTTTEPTTETEPNNGNSSDLAYDYWEVAESNELLDGEVTFWKGYNVALNDEDNYLTDEICTGDINFSIAPADTIYSFSDK